MPRTFSVIVAFAATVSAAQQPMPLTADQLIGICESSTVVEASKKGDVLGWQPVEDKAWKKSFENYNGGSVDVVGWRRGAKDSDGLLSFWISTGPVSTRMCSFYASGDGAALLSAFFSHFGKPSKLDKFELGLIADWERAGDVVELNQTGNLLSVSYTARK
ncbi:MULTISPECIES: hypothetical protein [Rhizobium]|uniref:Uncharacterized protein n=1 Tax=Rhizobium rhododendri TaxID=2506430 RepID=A0ABY8IFR7_9HYPH|nr:MULTISPECIES: hypothetical protein [Rhizobium]MBZ5783879.1 hypothetical protein [Rhizobium sp. VS19-DR121]MBZ5817183.1 hypothetical protein [Rhizobium sp. VS19-DR183]MBZ5830160.1 hypothetical protein [Rhizobium sp. VS19-DR104.2]MBZ5841377.1 hypothetical protein [Rhizobium sp. VS19-DR104.1]TQX86147.1 hypothetical protein EQW76_18430 [Rhizobium sp. rho-13.1]